MTSRLSNIVINAQDPLLVAGFWCQVLGWVIVEQSDEGVGIAATDGGLPGIDVLPVSEAKSGPNRLHLDVRADGVTTAEELERLLALGARRVDVGQPPDVSWVVLADPEGNEFCLLATAIQDL
jgi:predicted enzyme related to lactoylglutathione lyase